MGSIIDREIHNIQIACEELSRVGKQQGLNAFFGSAISFKRFPNFVYIRDEVSKAILKQANVPEEVFLEQANNQKLRTETTFEALWQILGRRCFHIFRFLAESAPNEPEINHYLIAGLAKAGVFRTLLTTNWDRYIEIALEKLPNWKHRKSGMGSADNLVAKLHGELAIPSSIVFTESDLTKKLARDARRLLTASLDQRPTLIFGYSGNDHDVLETFGQARSPQPVYWLCHNREDAEHLTEVWSTYDNLPPLRLIVPKGSKQDTPIETFDLTQLLERLSLDHELRVDLQKFGTETIYKYDQERFQHRLSEWSSRLLVWKCKLAAAQLFRELNDTKQALELIQSVEQQAGAGPLRAMLEGKVLHASILWEAKPNSRQALKIASSAIDVLESLPQARYRTLLLDAYDSAAMALYRIGRLDEAYAMCERGLKLKPSDPDLRNTKATVLFDLNKFDEALLEFDRVIQVARRRGRYSLLMDALNLKSIALPEAAKRDHPSMKERVDKQVECEGTRLELERIARIARSTFYLGCALINSAEDLHIKGDIFAAMDKATEALEIDRKTNPEDPDAAVTCEIMARILIDVAVIWCEGQEFQSIVQDGERIIAIGLRLAEETAEEKACLNALQAVYLAETGHYAEAEKIMDRSLSYSLRYKKRDNLGWAYLHKARIKALQNQWEDAAESLSSCDEYARDNPMRELYYNCQKLVHVLWTEKPLAYTEIPLEDFKQLAKQLAKYLDSQSTLRACDLVTTQRGANGQDTNVSWNRTDLLRAVYGSIDKNRLNKLLARIHDTYQSWEV